MRPAAQLADGPGHTLGWEFAGCEFRLLDSMPPVSAEKYMVSHPRRMTPTIFARKVFSAGVLGDTPS